MRPDLITLLNEFDPITLSSMNATANLQTRVDAKYIVPWGIFEALQRSLIRTHCALDIDGERLFAYETQYFDTPDNGLYRAHIQGQRKRFKVRTRRYVETGAAFLEIKLKGRRGETIKKRIPHDPKKLDLLDSDDTAFIRQCIADIYEESFSSRLVPTVKTLYRRSTLVAKGTPERVTCDFDLDFQRHGKTKAGLRQRFVLIEIKTPHGRGSSERELWRRGVRPMGGSKYCIGLSLTARDLKYNERHRQIQRYFS